MDLTPKLLTEGTDFQQVRRGYDPDEVDDFLERVAAAVSRLQGQLVEANRRAEAAEAAATRERVGPAQPGPENALVEEMQRTLVLAQRTADAAVREAREEADSLVSAARREAATVLTNGRQEADRYAAESRLQIADRGRASSRTGATRCTPTSMCSRSTSTRERAHLRTAVEELQRIVERSRRLPGRPPRGRGGAGPAAGADRGRAVAHADARASARTGVAARTGVPARAPGAAGAAPGTAVSCRS